MKLRAPEGCCAASHAGRAIDISADGMAEVEDDLAAIFVAHGFTPWETGESRPTSAATPRTPLPAPEMKPSTRRQSGICARPLADRAASPDGCAENRPIAGIAGSGIDEISALSRRELFAFLKAKEVSVSLPITNEELRAAARRAREADRVK